MIFSQKANNKYYLFSRCTDQTRCKEGESQSYFITKATTLVLPLTLGGLAFYSLRENRKINKKLQLQNWGISDQKAQLKIMLAKAQAAYEVKVNFYTNISHDLCTPLTLYH